MKLQLDTEKMTLKVEESVNLGDFMVLLEQLLPNEKWKEFKLIIEPILLWDTPKNPEPWIVPVPYPVPTVPYNPYPWWTQPWVITYGTNREITSKYQLEQGVYNIEVT